MTIVVQILSALIMFAGISLAGLSIYLSYDVFSGIGTNSTYQDIFGGMAVSFETIKFALVPVALYYWKLGGASKAEANKNKFIGGSLGFAFIVLMCLSIFASTSSLNQNSSKKQNDYSEARKQIASLDRDIAQLETEIAQLNVEIDIFIEAEKISLKADPKKLERDKKTTELAAKQKERENIVIPEQAALAKGSKAFADALGLDADTTASWIYIISSLFIDVFGAIGLLVGESLFRSLLLERKKSEDDQYNREEERAAKEHARKLQLMREESRLKSLHAPIPKENKAEKPVAVQKQPETKPVERPAETAKPKTDSNVVALNGTPVNEEWVRVIRSAIDAGDIPRSPNARQIKQITGCPTPEAKQLEVYCKTL